MKELKKVVVVGAVVILTTLGALACGGNKSSGVEPVSTASKEQAPPTSSGDPAASASPTTSATASASAEPPKAPPMKGAVNAFTRSATSGKTDKVGEKDGNFKPDGVKDVVLDVDYTGEATALFVMTTDATGQLTSEFDADTIVGDQKIPTELAPLFSAGKNTAGLAVYEGDKLLNGKDGGLAAPLAAGPHKLTLHISSKTIPKSAMTVYALLPDGTLVKGPVLSK